jgi:hypothetical protein
MAYERYGPQMRECIAGFNWPMFANDLATEWLPALPDLHTRLTATDGGYQLAMLFEALHDMGDPVGALRQLRAALAPLVDVQPPSVCVPCSVPMLDSARMNQWTGVETH